MKDFRPATELDMVWQWARAEVVSDRFSTYYGNLDDRIRNLVNSNNREALTESDWQGVTRFVKEVRAPLLKGLLRLGVTWRSGTISKEDVLSLTILNLPSLVATSPARTLIGLVQTFEKARLPANDPELLKLRNSFRMVRDQFSFKQMRGDPILISNRLVGPYAILEGYSRLSALASKYLHRELEEQNIPVLLGICCGIENWYLNDSSTSVRLY